MKKEISFKNNKGQTLRGDLYVPEEKYKLKYSAIIVCHGLGGNKDAQNKVDLAEALYKEGFVVLRFDFTGHGKSEGDYADTTLTQEVNDVKAAIVAMYSLGKVDRKKLGLIGHSLAGTVTVIEAATDSRIKSAAVIAAVVDMEKPMSTAGKSNIKKWQKTDALHLEGGTLKYSFFKDFKKYNILTYAKKIKIPFLVIHGTKDYAVGMSQAKALAKAAGAQLQTVDEGHIFDKKAIAPAVEWFKKTLR